MTTQSLIPERQLWLNVPAGAGKREVVQVPAKDIHPALVFAGAELPPAAANYLRVADNLVAGDWWTPRRIFVTSPTSGDGKTCTSFNLAWALTARGQSVLLLELNFSRPQFRTLLGDLRIWRGIEWTLRGWATIADSVFSIGTNGPEVCAVKDAVHSSELIMEHLHSLRSFLDQCAEKYDWLILDCPSVLSHGWNAWFRKYAGPTLLVVREEQTPLVEVRNAASVLGGNLKAVLLNDSESEVDRIDA
jgi:Mrp family chromosome partitioning ATPase